MSSTFMIETRFMSSKSKSPKSSVCVAGGASSNTFTLVFFSCTRRDSVNECRPAAASDWAVPQKAGAALNRYGHVDYIAAMVAFVAGPEASYVTGADLTVDGRMNA